MKALVKYGQKDGEVEVREVPEPVIDPNDVLLEVKAAGAGPIVIVGTEKDGIRLQAAKELTADYVLDVGTDDVRKIVSGLTSGQGVPLVIDAAGNEKALALSIDTVARRGQITKIGWGPNPVNISLDLLLLKTVKLQGTFSHTWPDWEAVLKMVGRGDLKMEPMITHRAKIEDWLPAFEAVEECRAVKAIFVFKEN